MQGWYRLGYWTIGASIRATWRVKATGRENVPATGAVILASNHLSFLDHFITGAALKRQLFFISKVQHFDSKVKAFFFKRWGVIPLARGTGDKEAFEASLGVLQRGDAFIIYPEGTRSLDGKLHKGHTGVARLALLTGAPVVPVACVGTFEAAPKGTKWPRFNRCEVRFGRPLDFSKFKGKDGDRDLLRQVTDTVMREIGALSGQEYVHEYQFNPEYASKEHGAKKTGEPAGAASPSSDRVVAKKRPKRRSPEAVA